MKEGRPHTVSSRAAISAANKGKTPWNVGKQHSEETRRRIDEGTRKAMARKAEEKRLARERLRVEDPEAYARIVAEEAAAVAASKLREAQRRQQKSQAAAKARAQRRASQAPPRSPLRPHA